MSEGGELQPPAASANLNNDKPRPKPVMTSAFINKGAKVFAPKIKGRRRPAPSSSTPTSTSASSHRPVPTASAEGLQAQSDVVRAHQKAPEQLLPSGATQGTAPGHTPQHEPSTRDSSVLDAQTETNIESSTAVATDFTTEALQQETSNKVSTESLHSAPEPNLRPHIADVEAVQLTSGLTSTEPVISDNHNGASLLSAEITQPERHSSQQPVTKAKANKPDQHVHADTNKTVVPTHPRPLPEIAPASDSDNAPVETAAGRPKSSSRTLPWTTVNVPDEVSGNDQVDMNRRKPAKKRRKGPVTLRNIDDEEESEGVEDAQNPAPRQKTKKARNKKRMAGAAPDADGISKHGARPTKKRRRERKERTDADDEAIRENEDGGDEIATRPKAKRKAIKKTAQTQESVVAGEPGNDEEQATKRKGRPPREDTPPEAENEVIDAETTFMGNLAARNIRVGKLSQREKKMREANWDEVRQKWREEEALGSSRSREEQAEVLKRLNETAQANEAAQFQGEQLEMGEDGQFRLKATARVIDQGAEADRIFEAMETVAEDDLTNRITHRSFLRNNKRNPQEFMLPGQGRRWNLKDTNDFYDALRMFGTDFMMISTLFPGATRRSIKLKFVREERADPDGVREALHGQVNSNWDQYLTSSGRQASEFKDPDEIMRELEEEKRSFDVQIAAAKEAAEEEKRQRRLAGIDSEAEEPGEKGNANKKQKRGKKDKAVTFAEEGVEVLGMVDENDGWGRD